MPEHRHISSARQHAAIMFTDIVGYTSLMGRNEEKAFEMLLRNRTIHQSYIPKFRGTLVKEIGDGILVSFPLASEAVRCAIEIQKACYEADIPLKIGLHEGEIVFKDADILGDTVNIASRLQEISKKGCVYISDSVYKSIKNKSDIEVDFLGEKTLKNVDEPIKIYNVNCQNIIEKSVINTIRSSLTPREKSIIVLPFENISSDPEQEYFSDGLTEEIITDLSHIKDLLVISRNSAMTFKSSRKTTKEISEKVNVRYVLEGSVRKAGNDIRITAQLIDALSDTHLWAEKYNGTLDDVFDIQEKVSQSITESLKLKLTSKEIAQINARPIDDPRAYECYFRARNELWKSTKESLSKTLQYLEKAIEIIGGNELLYAAMAETYFVYPHIGVEDQKYYMEKLEDMVKKIEYINPDSEYKYLWKGALLTKKPGAYREALMNFKRALDINPNDPVIISLYNFWAAESGKLNWTPSYIQKLIEIDPLTPLTYSIVGFCHLMNGQFAQALDFFKKMIEIESESAQFLFQYAHVMAINDKVDEAIENIEHQLAKFPDNTWTFLAGFLLIALKGEQKSVKTAVNEKLISTARFDETYSWFMAECYALLNIKEEAINWLENAVERGFINYPLFQKRDPFLENVRGEERFKKLMGRVKHEWVNFEL